MQTMNPTVSKLPSRRTIRKYPRHAILRQRGSEQTLRGVMIKLHQIRKKLLRENPHAYIDYSA